MTSKNILSKSIIPDVKNINNLIYAILVDDEKDIADLIEEVLRQYRFQNIKKVYTGMDAVQVCREYQPDVVVLDIMLPYHLSHICNIPFVGVRTTLSLRTEALR